MEISEEFITLVNNKINSGIILFNFFIKLNDLVTDDLIIKAWTYFINEKKTITNNIVYSEDDVIIYNNIFKPIFNKFYQLTRLKKDVILYFNCNFINMNNIAIIFKNTNFYIFSIPNDIDTIENLNNILIENNKIGKFYHIICAY